ncbi:MAG TPA: PIG-L family deacetylase [Bryobacteraceae bacterium]|nr:PIG-L family deacetylase [Bryobacteraceae bacterium]
MILTLYRRISLAKRSLVVTLTVASITPAFAQRELSGAAEAKLALDRLNVLGSVLMIAAHPDDENTALLAYFARGRKVRTGYLSLTRGEGGQNLIGPEQGDALGVIRTQELLAARRIDGAEQFFTRAIDFGFTKTPDETFQKWGGHDKILSDVVWVIRRFRPDVIVLRFTGTSRDGHGQHQVSAILGKEAFTAAADPKRFPEQLHWVEPWQAKRLMWNTFAFTRQQEEEQAKLPDKVAIDPGDYDPVLGHSYAEIAGMSRSMHRSQGMGASERRGSAKNFLVLVAGAPAKQDAFDGVDLSWNRIPGGGPVGELLAEAARAFDPQHPEKTVPLLIKARKLLAALHGPLADPKRRDLDEAIALCSGLWLEATADKYATVPGGALKINATAIDRERVAVEVESVEVDGIASAVAKNDKPGPLPFNEPKAFNLNVTVPQTAPLSQPYWLREPKQGDTYAVSNQLEIGLAENPPLLEAHFHLRVDSEPIEVVRPVVHRYVERSQGELTRPVIVEPPVALQLPATALLFPNGTAKSLEVQVKANVPGADGRVRIQMPSGFAATPASQDFHLANANQESSLSFRLTPPSQDAKGDLEVSAQLGDRTTAVEMQVINYSHIPPQVLFPPAKTELVRADVRLLSKNIGYVMGAGDEMPEALRQLGANVVLLSPDDLAHGDLSRFDAIVTGVRAYNTRPDLRANQERVLDYVKNGGTMVVQYNTLDGGFGGGDPTTTAHIGPYPLKIGRERVTVEEAPVEPLSADCALLHKPNEISAKDFHDWVQERGLYFASEWDPHYQALFETHDPGEKPLKGATLYTPYGKGAYVFTAFSWFRELPAGVPGAYRIFANLLSAAKVQ